MNTTLKDFCETNKISPELEGAFAYYCNAKWTKRFQLWDGETAKLLTTKMNHAQIDEMWKDFKDEIFLVGE